MATYGGYTVSELAKDAGATARTLRYYEERGLLNPARKGGRRVYSDRDRVRLKLILRGRRLGFSLSEIRGMLDLYDVDRSERTQLREALLRGEERIRVVDAQIHDLRAVRTELAELHRILSNELKARESADRR